MVTKKQESDNFFVPAANTKPYFKAAFEGSAGSGKSWTAAQMAIGLHKKIKSKKPVIILDTEKAAKFVVPLFEEAGIELLIRETHSAADLFEAMRRADAGATDILMIDSITHFWEDFLEGYKKRKKRDYFQIQDWGTIKPHWKKHFSRAFVNGEYHIMLCGRVGDAYDSEINEETNKREIVKVGIKMKAETETAYEPDILVLMERIEELAGKGNNKTKQNKIYRRATVLKGRGDLLDGKIIANPQFKDFEPAINVIMRKPKLDSGQSEEGDTAGEFNDTTEAQKDAKERKILLEDIKGQLLKVAPSQSAKDKELRLETLETLFDTRSWTKVTGASLQMLEDKLEALKKLTGSNDNQPTDNEEDIPF